MTNNNTQSLSEQACLQAAEQLLARRQYNQKGDKLAPDFRPKNIEDALAIQAATVKASAKKIVGWKCLLPPDPQQVVVAPILEGTLHQGAQCLVKPSLADKTLIEPEIAFKLGQDLPARAQPYTEQEIDQAIVSSHMALELMQQRYIENNALTFFDKLADCLLNQGVFIGPEITKTQAYQAAEIKINITTTCADGHKKISNYDGRHPNESAHKPVYWLINFMSSRGVSFKKDQVIITGSYAGAIEVPINEIQIEYQDLGKYQVSLKSL